MKLSDKNKIFEYLSTIHGGLNDFKIIEKKENTINPSRIVPISTIVYKETPLHFEISCPFETFDQYRYRYTVFGPNYQWSSYFPINQVGYFSDVYKGFQRWIVNQVDEYIKETLVTDLWEEYSKVPRAITFEKDNVFDASQFTQNEKQQISLALNDLKKLVIEKFTETQAQVELVSSNVEYLVEKVDILNKFDWRSVAIAVVVNICTGLMLDPDKAKMIWDWFVSLISTIPRLPF